MIITYFFFFFFQTSQLDKDRGWVWAWSWPCPWPRGIHRWWDWRGPLFFDGRITLPGRMYVYVYETIPGKKHMWLPGYPPPRLVVVCSWLGYAMLLLCFFFFSILILFLPLSGHTLPRLAHRDPHQYGHRVLSV